MDDVDAFLADLAEWAAGNRAEDAVQARARERWLRQQAAEEAQMAGLLADLAERATHVAVHTASSRTYRGRIAAVGADVIAMATPSRALLIAVDAITVVQPGERGDVPATTDRSRSPLTLAGALARLAQTGTRVLVGTADGMVVGEVAALGEDVLTMATGEGGTAYVRLGAVTDVVVPRSP